MRTLEQHEVGICSECERCTLTNGKGIFICEGYVELEIKCEECGFQGSEEYGFLTYRCKEDSMLWLE